MSGNFDADRHLILGLGCDFDADWKLGRFTLSGNFDADRHLIFGLGCDFDVDWKLTLSGNFEVGVRDTLNSDIVAFARE